LNPKKSKYIVKKVAQDLSLPEEMVEDLYSFYWESIRKHITQVDQINIFIENFGIFELKPTSLEKTILKYQNHVNKFDRTSFKSFPLYEKMQARLQILEKAKEQYNKEKLNKKEFKDGKNNTRNMEGQGENS